MSGSSHGAWMPILSFDPIEQIMFVGFAGLKVDTARQIQVIFDTIDRFWTRNCASVAAIDDLEKGRKHGPDLRPPCDVARPSAPGRTMEERP